MKPSRVGQIGLGTVGFCYAGHLLNAGFSLVAWDIDPDRISALQKRGARAADSAADLARQTDTVLVSLPSPEADCEVLLGEDGLFAAAGPGTLVIDTSTIDPETARRLYDAARALEIDYLEAPVSGGEPMEGGVDGARAGSLTFLCGGSEKAFERAKPIMETCGKHFLFLGEAGSGATLKLISNLASGIYNLVAAEALTLAAAAGFTPETLCKVFERTDGKSYTFTDYVMPRMRKRSFEEGFSVDLMHKDHRLVEDLARQLRVPLPINGLAMQLYQFMRAEGLGRKDYAYAAPYFAQRASVDLFDIKKRED